MILQNKIAILTCWNGPYPWYFSYFIHSCSYNPTIAFYIITDNQEPILNKPENIKIIHRTLEELVLSASNKLGFSITVGYPYKLCDFKLAYVYIFSDLVQDYDFWGYGDIDIIFENIRNFITDEILNEYDVITLRHDFLIGYFSLFRYIEKLTKLYSHSKDYRKVFENSIHFFLMKLIFTSMNLPKESTILKLAAK